MIVKRELTEKVQRLAEKFPVVSISGPRQSGKTTLALACFPDYEYVNLEFPDTRAMAHEDPREFLNTYREGLILDEVQNVPEIFSYLQVFADEPGTRGKYILTGSQNFLLLEKISQSLAGRAALLTLLPFSIPEIAETGFESKSYSNYIFHGSYPAVYDRNIEPADFYPSYIQSYLERDVRSIINIGNLMNFRKFLGIVAGRTGQIVNYTSIANDTGVDQKTIQRWISVLEASYIIFLLRPYHKNFNKRLIKSPKLYFYDTGLACSLLGIKRTEDIGVHFMKGALFENLVISEIAKQFYHRGIRPDLYFWRDNTGNEVDCLYEEGVQTKVLEIKAGTTVNDDFFGGLLYYQKISGISADDLFLIYGGAQNQKRSKAQVISWNHLNDLY